MQIDQRGGKDGCSGTLNNLLLDDMVLKDAQMNKKNLCCAWIDVKKAYDSLSHSWIKKVLEIHRVPTKIKDIISLIIDAWNITLVVPTENEDIDTNPVNVTNGVLQGDVMSGTLFTMSENPVSWHLRRYEGYKLSKPVNLSVTHSLFMDDLKVYCKSHDQLK